MKVTEEKPAKSSKKGNKEGLESTIMLTGAMSLSVLSHLDSLYDRIEYTQKLVASATAAFMANSVKRGMGEEKAREATIAILLKTIDKIKTTPPK